jgi:hypothetical protein
MINSRFIEILHRLHNKLNTDEINWVLTGSLGLALHGIDVKVNDIDIQTDKSGAYEIERRFLRYMVRKVEFSTSEKIRSHFGEMNIDDIKVEIMGDIQKCLPDGTWEEPIDIRNHRCFVDCDGLSIPALPLEYECEAYYKLGRMEKAKQIRRYLEQHQLGGKI